MASTLRWGIMSTGGIANAFAQALRSLPDADIAAVGSRTQDAADAFGDAYSIGRRHGSYEALAEDPDVDVIYIATPHPYHAENALLCLQHGKAVLLEKAFTINAREAEAVIGLARERRHFLMEAMMTRHLPVYHQVRRWVRDGRVGDVRLVECDRCIRIPFNPEGRHFKKALGGSALLDVGIYPISFATSILGVEPEAVRSVAEIGTTGVDEQAAVLMKFSGGAIANLNFALRTAKPAQVNIYGTDGYIEIHDPAWKANAATLYTNDGEPEAVNLPMENNGLQYEAAEVMRCLRKGLLESPIMPLDETLAIMRIMDALRTEWGVRFSWEEL